VALRVADWKVVRLPRSASGCYGYRSRRGPRTRHPPRRPRRRRLRHRLPLPNRGLPPRLDPRALQQSLCASSSRKLALARHRLGLAILKNRRKVFNMLLPHSATRLTTFLFVAAVLFSVAAQPLLGFVLLIFAPLLFYVAYVVCFRAGKVRKICRPPLFLTLSSFSPRPPPCN